jgi:hypothetical protein
MSIYDEVLSFIRSPAAHAFEALALDVFRYQFDHVPPYREYCIGRGADPRNVRTVVEIPAVSTVAFKYARMESRDRLPGPPALTFLTSGTTIGKEERGRHLVVRPEIYRASALNHLRRMLFPDGRRLAMLALHPTADRMPESSLSQMITWCIEEFGTGEAACTATPRGVQADDAIGFLRNRAAADEPVCILGTTASIARLFTSMRSNRIEIGLPADSRIMDTGGAKGQAVPLSPDEVVAEASRMLGVDPSLVINEYGMTEMCSQLYDATAFNSPHDPPAGRRMKLAPPWLRPAALDPVTLAPVEEGRAGILSFFDLANVGSVSALMTEDFGVVRGGAVGIIGRDAAADPRGCALAIEEFAIRGPAADSRPILR